MEGVRLFDFEEIGVNNVKDAKHIAAEDLKQTLSNLARHVFGDVEMKWSSDHFPFTDPSFELEIYYNDEWLEILGCGVIHDEVMTSGQRDISKEVGWAFGLGLERWAMKLFEIEDIR
jgi:phenylalanyl-tRNA synthetase alpha chain